MAVKQPNFNESLKAKWLTPRLAVIRGVVIHDTAGTGTHNDTKYLANPGDGRKVGVDFTVERDGSIWKLNPRLDQWCAPHAGRNTSFKGQSNGRVNRITVGIEICQKADLSLSPTYTPEQIASVAHLCAWLCQEFKLEPSDITTHRNIVTDGSRSDPRKFPFDGPMGFWHIFWSVQGKGDEYLASMGIKKIPVEGKKNHVVEKGDSFYGIARAYNVKPGELAEVNHLSLKSLLLPGQVLILP